MRYARHRRRTWAERHEGDCIFLTAAAIGILMGVSVMKFFC